GKSLRPLLVAGEDNADFREAIYYHYYDFPAFHMVKKMYGVRTDRYKLIHVYDDIDQWELYDLRTDPKELTNQIDNPSFDAIEKKLRLKLDELQDKYKVGEKEFEKASKQSVQQNYKNFERLRGNPDNIYQN
ncbi:MAG TPA: sulfatase/phosphatase domain-containing protein, partial [Aquaticitalea sp.]|nr:sulfatase/phosphatase domain-containing protein [Aquaticitalea sp.]